MAILAMVLFGIGAVSVDIGQAYAQRRDVQTQADLAILAGASELPNKSAVLAAAQANLDPNKVTDQDASDLTNLTECATATPPASALPCILFDPTNEYKAKIFAPEVRVNFGLGKIFEGTDHVEVGAQAAVEIRSPDTGVLPAFAVGGCDYGPETLLDPTGGPPESLDLYENSPPYNSAVLTDPLAPDSVDINTTGQNLVINGTNLSGVVEVGFSLDGGSPFDGGHVVSTPSSVTSTAVTVAEIPSTVTSTEGAWYVRVKTGTGRWSDPDEALSLLVGDAFLECDAGPTDGNFGTLLLPRSDGGGTDEQLARNIIDGLDFTLAPYPGAASDWTCSAGDGTAVVSDPPGPLNDGTNCVDTDTGFAQHGASMGLITGDSHGHPGVLDAPTSDRCTASPHNRSDWTYVAGPGDTYSLNDDTLTCFFTNDTTTIGELDETYAGPPVIADEIFESPRFFWVPVLGVDPDSGGSDMYQIIEFRPAFITDQLATATRVNPQVGASGDTYNGIEAGSAGIQKLKVVFFSPAAFPESVSDVDGTVPYLGVGPKVLQLVE